MSCLNSMENVDVVFRLHILTSLLWAVFQKQLHFQGLCSDINLSYCVPLMNRGLILSFSVRYMHEQLRVSLGVHKQLHVVDFQNSTLSVISPVFSISQELPFLVFWPGNWELIYSTPLCTCHDCTQPLGPSRVRTEAEKKQRGFLPPSGEHRFSNHRENFSSLWVLDFWRPTTATVRAQKTEKLFFKGRPPLPLSEHSIPYPPPEPEIRMFLL